jgi:hypothetical protein
MMSARGLRDDERGAAVIEMAFALPTLIVIIWMFVQLANVYRALAGIQQALGEGARYATLCLNPTATGCTVPTGTNIRAQMFASVYGIGPGQFSAPLPVLQTAPASAGGGRYYDLTVSYTQSTNLLLFPGPDISVQRSKRVWVVN